MKSLHTKLKSLKNMRHDNYIRALHTSDTEIRINLLDNGEDLSKNVSLHKSLSHNT